LLILVSIAACHSTKQVASPPSNHPTQVSTVEPTACPSEADIISRLRARWFVAPDKDMQINCKPGLFPAPGWVIDAVVNDGEGGAWERAVVLRASDGSAIAESEQEPIQPWMLDGGALSDFDPIDLDGDGVAELIGTVEIDHGGAAQKSETIYRIDGGKIADVKSFYTHYDDSARFESSAEATQCDATITFSPPGAHGERTIIYSGTGKIGATPDLTAADCPDGHHEYVLKNGKLVE
jgi:hypothetical protein